MTYEELEKALAPKVILSEAMIAQLKAYAALLKEWNEKMNLTAISEESEVIEKHFYDCLIPAKAFSFEGKSICDLGTGAGFPGLVLAIAFPTSQITLVDATLKKVHFLEEVIKSLGLKNVKIVNGRAESYSARESFDIVTARAVAPLPELLEISVALVKVGGIFLAMKGSKGKEELAASKHAIEALHLNVDKIDEDSLPSGDGARVNIFFKKNHKTESQFPRSWSEIEKKPL
jgi:16S rRNA (guanine527-N7)-methyltransferase